MSSQQSDQIDLAEIDVILLTHQERRFDQRHPYRVVQKMAPIRNGVQGRFRDVNCSDISASGISFYFDSPPDFEEFAITLNHGEHQIRVLGRIVSHEQVKGATLFLVDSQFTKRVDR